MFDSMLSCKFQDCLKSNAKTLLTNVWLFPTCPLLDVGSVYVIKTEQNKAMLNGILYGKYYIPEVVNALLRDRC